MVCIALASGKYKLLIDEKWRYALSLTEPGELQTSIKILLLSEVDIGIKFVCM